MVFYTGNRPYNVAQAIWELCGPQAELMRQVWQSPFLLIDVNTVPEEQLTSHLWAGTMEFIMRNRFKQQLIHEIKKIAPNLNCLIHKKDGKLVLELLTYIVNIDDEYRTIQDLTNIIHELSPDVEKEVMSLADQLREEGRQEVMSLADQLREESRVECELKGKLDEKISIAQRLLTDGVDPVFVAKATELPLDRIKAMQQVAWEISTD